MLNSYEKFVKDIGLVFGTDFAKILASIFIIPIITKTLGAAGFGVWNQLRITITLVSTFIIMGLHHAFLRHLAGEKEKDKISSNFWAVILTISGLGIFLALSFYILSDSLYTYIFGKEEIPHLVTIATVLMVIFPLDYFMTSYFQTFRQMKNHSALTIGEMATQVGLLILLISTGYGIFGAVLSFLIVKIVFLLLRVCKIVVQIGFTVPDFSIILPYIRFGLPMVLSGTFFLIVNSGDRYVINYFLGIREVGIYSFAYNIGNLIMVIMTPVMYILYPTIANCWHNKEYDNVKRYLRYSIKYNLFLSIPCAFFLGVLSEEITLILSSSQFLSGSLLIPLLSAAFLIFGFGVVGEHMMIVLGRTRAIFYLYFFLSFSNILMNIILVPRMGIRGAALITLISFTAYAVITLYTSWKKIKYHLEYSPLYKAVVAASVASFALWWMKSSSISHFAFSLGLAVIIYIVLLYLFGGVEKKEIEFLINVVFPQSVEKEGKVEGIIE
jgi:O-antigen/teichoic acid export membrane protein